MTEPPQSSRAGVTEDRALSASENSGHPSAVWSQRGTPYRVDAGANAMQPPGLDSAFDLPSTEAEFEQLLASQNLVLPSSQTPSGLRSLPLPTLAWRLVNLPPHTVEKSPIASDSPPVVSREGDPRRTLPAFVRRGSPSRLPRMRVRPCRG